MKKILSILGAVGLTATASSAVVSCSNEKNVLKEGFTCRVIKASASKVKDGYSTVTLVIDQTMEASYSEDTVKLFSVVNDQNEIDQKNSDSDKNNFKDVDISDISITTSDAKIHNEDIADSKNKLVRFNVTFKVKIESISEHHVFEWIKYSDSTQTKYNVYKTFMVKLPGVK